MKIKRSRTYAIMLCFALLGLSVSCSKEEIDEPSTVVQTLSEQIQGDWKLVQCNEMAIAGGSSEAYPVYEIGGLWKFFMGTDSPIGEIWINGVHKFHYIITGDMIRIYDDYYDASGKIKPDEEVYPWGAYKYDNPIHEA